MLEAWTILAMQVKLISHETKATFSLLMELSRLDLQTRAGDKPVLTLPIGR